MDSVQQIYATNQTPLSQTFRASFNIVLASLGGPVPDPRLPEKFLGYYLKWNPDPLGWQSDALTTIRKSGQAYVSTL